MPPLEAIVFHSNGLLEKSSSLKDASLVEADSQLDMTFESNGLLEDEFGRSNGASGLDAAFKNAGVTNGLEETQRTAAGMEVGGEGEDGALDFGSPAHSSPMTKDLGFGLPQFRTATDILSSINRSNNLHRPKVLACKSFDGKTVVLTYRPPEMRVRKSEGVSTSMDGVQLLEVPFHRLMDQLAREAANADNTISTTTTVISSPSSASKSPDALDMWVDRYRPRKFMDLMGDERVNREVMSWLKEWDHCVFGRNLSLLRKKRKRENEGWSANGNAVSWNGKSREDGNYKDFGGDEDPWQRPREKVALLGRFDSAFIWTPGLGKTTLAHVVAKQAGYAVLEVNASDDRSGAVIENRVRPALESGRAMGSSLPVCVVVDEIDGATGEQGGMGFVGKLVSLTFDPPNLKKRLGADMKKTKRPLMRPIICICNDLYASSLAKLRPHARILRMNPSPPVLLTKRLRDICEHENLRAESRALTLLTSICQGDLRACLNVLQGIKTRSQAVTESAVRTSTKGIKQGDVATQFVWSELLTPMNKKKAKGLGLTEVEESKYVSRLGRCIDGHTGGADKVVLGMFEHYTTLHRNDTTLRRFEAANEWLSNYDMMSSSMRIEQEFGLMQYLPYSIIPLHHHLAVGGPTNQRVERPTAYWDSFNAAKSGEEVLDSLRKAVLKTAVGDKCSDILGYRYLLGWDVLRTEFAPLLNRIISPPIRPINKHLIKGEELKLINRLVNIMVSLGLRFEQERTEDGQLAYRLEPPIDVFTTYEGKKASDIAASRYVVRRMIAAEIEQVISAWQNDVVEKGVTRGGGRKAASKERSGGNDIDIADQPVVDFFGRPIAEITPKPVSNRSEPPLNDAVATFRLHYKYNEGNSCAVRKPTKMVSFL
ncbi:uncharacterized protein EI90DRAFT_3063580 [Cantharellus anzutake]|uniref:uncharacterized protein n=1 Tax=Cantharellus anzutake TaxID=1750568 RepID=UPI001903F69A|nr:uncharacterized protein EI90DRAFT_3063580 [Cantharellus anzutake]KAF8328797.1 hypothetical protein EI90DRAFT_3063580 [Cantharellus anzutake]